MRLGTNEPLPLGLLLEQYQINLPLTTAGKAMARFAIHGAIKMLLNGETPSLGCDARDPFGLIITRRGGWRKSHERLSSLGLHGINKNGVSFPGGSRVCSLANKSGSLKADDLLNDDGDGDDDDDDEEEEVDEDEAFERDELSCFRGLVLDISYRPINVVCWRRAICLEFMEKAEVLEYYDQTVSSPRGSFYVPAVLRVPHLLQVVKRRRIKHNLSRKNILFRDYYTCQYCSSRENLTIDHVLPISLGGEWTWENLVTACSKCNSKKGQKTLEEAKMALIKLPKAPKDYDILAIPLTSAAARMLRARKGVPEEWLQYLSKPKP